MSEKIIERMRAKNGLVPPPKAEAPKQEAPPRPKKSKRTPEQRDNLKGRLPHGAAYLKTYDAATETWTGTLTIPGAPVFSGTVGGSFSLEAALDTQYREWLKAQESQP